MRQRDKDTLEAARLRRQGIDENPPRCALEDCRKVIPKPRRYQSNVKFCSGSCANKQKQRQLRLRKAVRRAEDQLPSDDELYSEQKVRRGHLLDKIRATLDEKELDDWVNQRISDAEMGKRMSATPQAVGMARRAEWNDRIIGASSAAFTPSRKHLEMLGPPDAEMRRILHDDPTRFDSLLDVLVQAFVDWRDEFFDVTSEGKYLTKPVHRRWIRATLKTIYTGGRQLILSPPRHGKTDLLIHFCVWLILRDPMIRILWIGPNDDVAQNSLGQVRNLLEGEEELRKAYLGEFGTWAPQKRGAGNLWQSTKFTVQTRPIPRKQPTMWCAGVKGKILSLDADFIIVDDPADPDDSTTDGGRDGILRWFRVKLLSRKMNFTGLVMISSRVHVSDLYSNYVESDQWDVLVDRAHDQGLCGKDLFDEHPDPVSCVLFPEINPLPYLREQFNDVGAELFDMMYLNQPRPDGTLIFDPDKIRANCLDPSRGIGLAGVPHPYRLVAGLDPAARGVQAAFLWAVRLPSFLPNYDPNDPRFAYDKLGEGYYMIDTQTQQAGGIEGAVKVMEDWYVTYGCDLWVVEDVSYQKVFWDDPRVKKLKGEGLIHMQGHDTGKNKHDADFGIAKTAELYHSGKVSLPYATPDAQRKTNQLITQLTNFTGAKPKRAGEADILMASWFPHNTVIKKWRKDERHHSVRHTSPASYPGYVSSELTTLPWGHTSYPNMGN